MKHLIIALKGLFVGGTMLVPGVSGGSMAMILGIYHELIASISSFLKHKKESLLFLGVFVAGALVGMALFARPLEALIERFPMPTLYFFIGAVVGGVPLMVKESGITSFSLKRADSWKDIGFALVGLVIVAAFEFIPAESWGAGALTGNAPFYLLLIAGLVASVALVLPGISVSYILLVMGLYEELTRSLTDFNFAFLAPLALWANWSSPRNPRPCAPIRRFAGRGNRRPPLLPFRRRSWTKAAAYSSRSIRAMKKPSHPFRCGYSASIWSFSPEA